MSDRRGDIISVQLKASWTLCYPNRVDADATSSALLAGVYGFRLCHSGTRFGGSGARRYLGATIAPESAVNVEKVDCRTCG